MKTIHFNQETITQAAYILKKGELLAFPTETVYGLGADATNNEAIQKIFIAKGRPSDNPLIVHIASVSQLEIVTNEWSKEKDILANFFWPGPLTIISKRSNEISPLVSSGLTTVGIRIPEHPLALELLALVNKPIAAPSANLSGRPSPTTSEMVSHDLEGRIEGILTTKEALTFGLESTVVSLDESDKKLYILREGFITREELQDALPSFKVLLGKGENLKASPGTKYAHYQPSCPVFIFNENLDLIINSNLSKIGILLLNKSYEKLNKELSKVGWQLKETKEKLIIFYKDTKEIYIAPFENIGEYAKNFYSTLFLLEKKKVKGIFCKEVEKKGIGEALMNRLERSSSLI